MYKILEYIPNIITIICENFKKVISNALVKMQSVVFFSRFD